MSRKDRLDRKALKQPDGFMIRGRAALLALFEQRRYIIGGVAAVLALTVGLSVYSRMQAKALNEDWTAIYEAEQGKAENRVEAFKALADSGRRNRATFVAVVGLADHYLRAAAIKAEAMRQPSTKSPKGKDAAGQEPVDPEPELGLEQVADEAASWFEKALAFSVVTASERELLGINHGQSAELKGDYAAALERFASVADKKGENRPLALIHAGRMHELLGAPDKAREAYASVYSEFGGTEYARLARNYSRRIGSPLFEEAAEKP